MVFFLDKFKQKYGIRKFTWSIHFIVAFVFSLIYKNLLTPEDFNGGEGLKTYTDHLYYSVVTHASVGYGDISPKTPRARFFVTMHIVIAFVLIISLWL